MEENIKGTSTLESPVEYAEALQKLWDEAKPKDIKKSQYGIMNIENTCLLKGSKYVILEGNFVSKDKLNVGDTVTVKAKDLIVCDNRVNLICSDTVKISDTEPLTLTQYLELAEEFKNEG